MRCNAHITEKSQEKGDLKMSDVYLTIIAQNSKTGITAEGLKPEHSLSDDLGYDSISFVAMIVGLEEAYNISFDEDYFDPDVLKTVQNVADYIASKI